MELTAAEIIAGVAVLIGFIATLLKVIGKLFTETKTQLTVMESRHFAQTEHVTDLTGKVNRLEGEREGFIMGVEKISNEVIREVRSLKND